MTGRVANLLVELDRVWRRSDRVFELVRPNLWTRRPLPLRHPPLFYLGHLPAFAWNQLGRGVLELGHEDAALDVLFERGIDPLTAEAAADVAPSTWPEVEAVLAYRDRIRSRIWEIASAEVSRAVPMPEVLQVLNVIIEHEMMHHETLLYLLQAASREELQRPLGWPVLTRGLAGKAPDPMDIPAGRARMGSPGEPHFAWCNEQPAHEVSVQPFRLDRVPVDNAHFVSFVRAGGYAAAEWWSDEGWAGLAGRTHPQSWRSRGDGFEVRSLLEWHPLEEVGGWPVQVSASEARAYAAWKGARLPTEAELQWAAYGDRVGPVPGDVNVDFARGGPVPVGTLKDAVSPFGVHELVGNGW